MKLAVFYTEVARLVRRELEYRAVQKSKEAHT